MASERKPEVIQQIRQEKFNEIRKLFNWCESHDICDDCPFAEIAHTCSIEDIGNHYFIKGARELIKGEHESQTKTEE